MLKIEKNCKNEHFHQLKISMKMARDLQKFCQNAKFRHFIYLQTRSHQKISKSHGDISL